MPKRVYCPDCKRAIIDARYGACRVCWFGRLKAIEDAKARQRNYAQHILVTGDCAVVADIHVPYQNSELLADMVDESERHGIRKLVIGGDLIDWEEISRFQQRDPNGDPTDSLRQAVQLLELLSRQYDRIICIRGNHELRLERMMDQAVSGYNKAQRFLSRFEQRDIQSMPYQHRYHQVLDGWTSEIAPSLKGKVQWLSDAQVEIEGPAGERPWRFMHQKTGSRNPTIEARHHWQRWLQPIICTHTHLWGVVLAPDGKTPLVQLGTSTVEGLHEYTWREPTGWPTWVSGFGLIRQGVLTLYPKSPYLDLRTVIPATSPRKPRGRKRG